MKNEEFERKRDTAISEKKQKFQEKLNQIQLVNQRNKEIEAQKVENFFNKKAVIEKRKAILSEVKQEEQRQNEIVKEQKQTQIQECLQTSHEKFVRYQEALIDKQQNTELKVRNKSFITLD